MRRLAWLTALPLLLMAPAAAQLPGAPSQEDVRALLGRLHTEAAGHSSPQTRARLEAQVAAATGRPERLQNGAGLILTLRGYPWEGLWFLTQSAQTTLEQPDVLSNAGLLLVLIQRHDDAERLLLYATHEWPEFDPAWTNLARLYCDRRDYRLAQECLDRGNSAQPGSPGREELALRMAVEQRDPERAANHAVNVANLEPHSALLRRVLPTIPEASLARALGGRAEAIPLPETFVQLDEPLGGYEDFVLDELERQYWQAAFQHFTEIGTEVSGQTIAGLPPEVFERLPANIQATLRAQGVGPEQPLAVLNPTESRTHYLRLHLHLVRYQRRYQHELSPAFKQGVVELVFQEQRDRVHQLSDEYAARVKAGDDPVAAANEYCRDVIGSMNGAHPRFLRALAEARRITNRIVSRHWGASAGLIPLVPEAYRADEIAYLRRQAALSSQYYSGYLVRWYTLGLRAIVLDRAMADAMAASLHEAARARELESIIARERRRAEREAELEDGEGLELPIERWVGLDLGIFAIKVKDDEIEISGGEGLVGEASLNWEEWEFEVGVGVGFATPVVGPLGVEGKVLGAVRIGGSEELAFGIHSAVEASLGSPVIGEDVNIVDDYLWITNAGHPDQAILGSPWREP